MTAAVLRQMLGEEAALAGYQDLFFIFAALPLFSLVPVLLLRGDKLSVASAYGVEAMTGKQRRAKEVLAQPPVDCTTMTHNGLLRPNRCWLPLSRYVGVFHVLDTTRPQDTAVARHTPCAMQRRRGPDVGGKV